METVASVPTSLMSAVIALAGFGMVAGNLLSARLAGRFSDRLSREIIGWYWYSNGTNTCRQRAATEAEAKAQAAAHVKGQIIKATQV